MASAPVSRPDDTSLKGSAHGLGARCIAAIRQSSAGFSAVVVLEQAVNGRLIAMKPTGLDPCSERSWSWFASSAGSELAEGLLLDVLLDWREILAL